MFLASCHADMSNHTFIDLLRHGETEGGTRFRGSTNDSLTTLGWAQLRHATDKHIEKHETTWDRIITSPLDRCADFAQFLGEKYAIPVTSDKRLQEMHFGEWEGRTVDELMETDMDALSQFWSDPIANTPPQAETLIDFEKRVLSGWRDITHQFLGERILLVTHGGVIRLLLGHILQRPLQRLLEIKAGHAVMHHIRIEHTQPHTSTAFIETKIC
jgi:alpha-ribazole phosphatase